MSAAPVFASASEALDVARAALGYLAAADATRLTSDEQAGCLRRLERLTSVTTAARASVLGAFTFGKGYSADADYSPRAWLIHKTGITRGAAVSYTAWAKRAAAHPRVFEVLAGDGDVSESFARTICLWTDKLPASSRDTADGILIGGAVSGLALPDLAVLASEMLARSWQPDRQDPADGPEDQDGQSPGRPDGEPSEPGGTSPAETSPAETSPALIPGMVPTRIRTASPSTAGTACRPGNRTAMVRAASRVRISIRTGRRMRYSRIVR